MILLDGISPIMTILTELFNSFKETLPKMLAALVVLIIGWIIAKLIAKVVRNIVRKTPLDELAGKLNDIDVVQKTNIEVVPSSIIAKTLYYILMMFFIIAAAEILDMAAISELISDMLNYMPRLFTALVMLMIGVFVADGIKNIIFTICNSLGIPSSKLIAGFVFWVIFLTLGVSAISQAGIDTEFIKSNLSVILAGGVFAFALGYGIASKDMMANFLASFYSKDKFNLGDMVAIDGAKGEIIDIDNNSMVIQEKNKKVIIPLKKLTSDKIEIFDA